MTIGTVKEIKKHEYRVGLIPSCVKEYTRRGHTVLIEKNAGKEAGFLDHLYKDAGGIIVSSKEAIFDRADMIVKVKEPQEEEFDLFRKEQILYTYLHLAADRAVTDMLLEKKIKAIAYETIQTEEGDLPCLTPMSEIAGRLSVQEGAKYLEKTFGGRGILLGGVPGVPRGKVAILGGGVVGTNAAKIAAGMGADVTVLDVDAKRLVYLDDIFGSRITTLYSTAATIEQVCRESDLIIGAVLIPGARAPKLIKREHLKLMKPGSVLVDVAVDQGGCIETTHPTTHDKPIYSIDNIVHYAVANMPGAVARTSTIALTSTTQSYGLLIADRGVEDACRENKALARGVNCWDGKCCYDHVAEAFNLPFTPLKKLL